MRCFPFNIFASPAEISTFYLHFTNYLFTNVAPTSWRPLSLHFPHTYLLTLSHSSLTFNFPLAGHNSLTSHFFRKMPRCGTLFIKAPNVWSPAVPFTISVEATHVPYVWLHVVPIVKKFSGCAWFTEVRAQSTLMVFIDAGVRVGNFNCGKYLL